MTTASATETADASGGFKLSEWIFTTDHKRIGILYLIGSIAAFLVAGLMALGIRVEQAAIGKLNERGREIIDMRYQQNLKPQQIADRVGTSPTAITSLLHRIRKSLEGCVKQQLVKMEGR